MITSKEIELFKTLFQKSPKSIILHINNDSAEIKDIIDNFINEIDGKLTYKNFNEINIERFRLTARDFEYVIVSNCLDLVEDIDKFIKEIYHSLENSANIILIENKLNNNLLFMKDILERNDFRATNSIEIFEEYNLTVAKKMHMWGNGL
ncbi:MAG: hypothetical protein PHF17_10850 [Arcobacteraceae bacterium]|jgi:ubiquinone/menaquinone biosynthesis C-methylase UbiE|nr:hypothetical protein [Arcobacteraceae bacterium]